MCFDFSLRQNGVGQSEDNYDPLKDGYIIHTISKSAKIYLATNLNRPIKIIYHLNTVIPL